MSCLLEQTAHLTFLGIFLIKSMIPLTILSTLAIMPSTTPILVKLICISSFGKNFPQELYLSPNFRSCGISGNRPFTANRLQKGVGHGKPEKTRLRRWAFAIILYANSRILSRNRKMKIANEMLKKYICYLEELGLHLPYC